MCDSSFDAKFATAFAIVFGIPVVLSLASLLTPESWIAWARTLQKGVSDAYLVEKLDFYVGMAAAQETLFTKTASEMKKRATRIGSSKRGGFDAEEPSEAADENLLARKSAVMEYLRKLLRQRHHYWGLAASLFPDGKLETWFGQFEFPAGFLEDFLFYLCNTNPILGALRLYSLWFAGVLATNCNRVLGVGDVDATGGVLAHPDHPITPRAHRVIFATTHSFGLCMYALLHSTSSNGDDDYDDDGGSVDPIGVALTNYLVIIPATVILDRLVFYLIGCPCLHDAHQGSKSYQQAAKAAKIMSNLMILPCFFFALIMVGVTGYFADDACLVLNYLWENLIIVAVLDTVKALPRFFLWTPYGFMAFDTILLNTGSWLLEREQERRFMPGGPLTDPAEHAERVCRVCCYGCCCCDCKIVSFEPFLSGAGRKDEEGGDAVGGIAMQQNLQADAESGVLTPPSPNRFAADDNDEELPEEGGLVNVDV